MKVVSHRRAWMVFNFILALILWGGWTDKHAQAGDIDFTQCLNDAGNLNAIGTCTWANGAINQINSFYNEGNSVPQRLFHNIDTAGTHTIRLSYDFTKANIYAYDFLSTPDLTQNGELLNQCGNLPGFVTSAICSSLFSSKSLVPIPSDSFDGVSSRQYPTTRNFFASCSPSCTGSFTISNITHVPSTVCAVGACGDSSVTIDISFQTASANTVVALWFGAHLAVAPDPDGAAGNPVGWGTGFGASSIQGSPFHVKYASLDGDSVGKRDNQMSAGAVVDLCGALSCNAPDLCSSAVCVAGVCVYSPKNQGVECRAATDVCDVAEVCDGVTTACPADGFIAANTNTVCRPTAGTCDVAETCNGTSAACPADGFASGSTVCRPSAGVCDVPEACTGSSANCPADTKASAGTACGDSSTSACDLPDTCNGAGVCQPNYVSLSTACADDGNQCTNDWCNGAGACIHPAKSTGTACGDLSTSACDLPDTCNGAGVCQPNYVSLSTACADDGNQCTNDWCNGAGACIHPAKSAGTACGNSSTSACDLPDTCNGAGVCLANHKPTTTVCRPATDVCDVPEYCNADGTCQGDQVADNKTLCRTASGLCDIAEYCNGSAKSCPSDEIKAPGTTCRPSVGSCDVPEVCNGGTQCPTDIYLPAGDPLAGDLPCRESAGLCDPEEYCTGKSPLCPVNVVFDPNRDKSCEAEFCQTAGFWSTHAGTEKKNGKSQNITLAVIDLADGIRNLPAKDLINLNGLSGKLNICGENIVNTQLNDAASALESMCVSPQGDQRLQLVRQLTAASLNCVLSTGSADCVGVDGPSNITVEDLFAACNTACIGSGTTITDGVNTISCIAALDCWNNGGIFHEATNFCQTGTCSLDGVTACNGSSSCPLYNGLTQTCISLATTCHDQRLVKDGFFDFDPPGPAGSSDSCNQAIANKCTVVAPGEVECKDKYGNIIDSAPLP